RYEEAEKLRPVASDRVVRAGPLRVLIAREETLRNPYRHPRRRHRRGGRRFPRPAVLRPARMALDGRTEEQRVGARDRSERPTHPSRRLLAGRPDGETPAAFS